MTSPLLVEITQLWAKKFVNDEVAYASKEFKRLCDVAAEVHCRPGSPFELEDKNDVAMHATDMRNAFKNIGAPWNADLPLPPAAAAEAIDKAYAPQSCMLTHLIPLDLADELPSVRFGPWRIQSFDSKELANLVGLARLNRFGHTKVLDVKRLSSFRWAVLEESISIYSENRWRHLFRGWDDIGKVRHIRRQFEPAIERGLFVLSLYPWEDHTEADYVTWKPFRFPWVYTVKHHIFASPQSAPDADSLTWTTKFTQEGEDFETPQIIDFDTKALGDLERNLNDIWERLARLERPKWDGTDAFNPLVERFLLRAFGDDDLDQLLWHVTAVDAAIGMKERSSTKAIKRRVETLLGNNASGKSFGTYYDIRSGYVHGRQLQDPNLWQRDLAGARRLARRVAYETLKLVSDNRGWSRADLLQYLDR